MSKIYSFGEILKEGFGDRRLLFSLGADAYGALSVLGYSIGGAPGIAGDVVDLGTSIAHAGWIRAAYGDELGKIGKWLIPALGYIEEAAPGAIDLIPSATIAHFIAAKNRLENQDDELV